MKLKYNNTMVNVLGSTSSISKTDRNLLSAVIIKPAKGEQSRLWSNKQA